jgi:hypothetical protein
MTCLTLRMEYIVFHWEKSDEERQRGPEGCSPPPYHSVRSSLRVPDSELVPEVGPEGGPVQ